VEETSVFAMINLDRRSGTPPCRIAQFIFARNPVPLLLGPPMFFYSAATKTLLDEAMDAKGVPAQ
jgi:hypothetical protein